MAKKIILMKLLEEMRGHANVTNRRPTPPAPMLYLMQLRRRNAHAYSRASHPPQRLAITAHWENPGESPAPIKIHHSVAEPSDMPIVIG